MNIDTCLFLCDFLFKGGVSLLLKKIPGWSSISWHSPFCILPGVFLFARFTTMKTLSVIPTPIFRQIKLSLCLWQLQERLTMREERQDNVIESGIEVRLNL